MSPEKDYESLLAEMMKAKAQEDGLDPSKIDSGNVHVDTDGPTIKFGYKGATVSVPAPSRAALDQWFKDNGQYIAGSLMTLVSVGVGVAIGKKNQ